MEFEWDLEKAEHRLSRHGVAFTEAMTVFGDPLEVTIPDATHSEGEYRFLSLGTSEAGRLLVVAYTEREGRTIMSQGTAREEDDLRPECDFSAGARGKHFEAYRKGTNVVFLDRDVAAVFKDSTAVNTALRLLLTLAREQAPRK